jgi:hypothetical protein
MIIELNIPDDCSMIRMRVLRLDLMDGPRFNENGTFVIAGIDHNRWRDRVNCELGVGIF